jgi:hypothetical protein
LRESSEFKNTKVQEYGRKAEYDKSKVSMLLNQVGTRNQLQMQAVAWENPHYYTKHGFQMKFKQCGFFFMKFRKYKTNLE